MGDGGGGGGGGEILPPEEEQKPPKPNNHIFLRGSSVEVLKEDNGFKGVFFTATVLLEPSPSSESSRQKLLVQYHNLSADEGGPERLVEYVDISSVRPEPPSSQERVEGFEVGEVVDAYRNDGWWIGVVAHLVGGGGEKSRLRFTVSFSHSREVCDFRASDLRPHWDWVDGAWIKPEKQVRSTPHIRKYSRVIKRCASTQSRVCSTTPKRRILRARQQDHHIDRTIAEDSTSDSPNSPRKRRRRRRRVGAQSVTESETTKTCKDRRSSGKSRGRPRKNPNQASSGKRKGRPRKYSFKDNLEASGEQTKEKDPEIEETVNIAPYSKLIDDRSLSMSIEEMQSPPRVASKNLRGNNENIRIEMCRDRTNGEMLQEDSGNNNLESNQQHNVSLPFVKNENLWKTIESMDCFKRTPQSPHFMPLENFGECSREGLAIGLMVTFSSVVDKVSKLRFSDPQSNAGDIMGAIADLESHGFDVRWVRKRVNDFLAMKDKNQDRLEEVRKLNDKLVARQYEKTIICDEMQRLQSANAKADEDIASLRSKLWEAEEVIRNAEEDWLKIVNTSELNDD